MIQKPFKVVLKACKIILVNPNLIVYRLKSMQCYGTPFSLQ